jgi:hypothetical protein
VQLLNQRAGVSTVYKQAIKIRSCQHARVLHQAHAQLRFTESSISSFGTIYEVLTLGGVSLQWSLRHPSTLTEKRPRFRIKCEYK